jgi:hypothetical protein
MGQQYPGGLSQQKLRRTQLDMYSAGSMRSGWSAVCGPQLVGHLQQLSTSQGQCGQTSHFFPSMVNTLPARLGRFRNVAHVIHIPLDHSVCCTAQWHSNARPLLVDQVGEDSPPERGHVVLAKGEGPAGVGHASIAWLTRAAALLEPAMTR